MPSSDLRRYLIETTRFKSKLGFLPAGFNYLGGEDYVLDRGLPFESEFLTPEEREIVLAAAATVGRRFNLGYCYHNAQVLVASDPTDTLQYCEGWAMGVVPLPVQHAWALVHDKVVDLTWRTATRRPGKLGDRILGTLPRGWSYYGVRFAPDNIRARIARMRATGSILEDLANGFPIFREPRLRSLPELLKRGL